MAERAKQYELSFRAVNASGDAIGEAANIEIEYSIDGATPASAIADATITEIMRADEITPTGRYHATVTVAEMTGDAIRFMGFCTTAGVVIEDLMILTQTMRGTDGANTVAPDNASITAIKAKTDTIPTDPATTTNVTDAVTALTVEHDATQAAIAALPTPLDAAETQTAAEDALTAYGASTLDAAGVRGAVGLAAADLDAKIAAIPTDVDATLSLSHGAGLWGAAGSSGAIPLVITFVDALDAPLQGVQVVARNEDYSAIRATGLSDNAGQAVLNLDAGTYAIFPYLPGYSFTLPTLATLSTVSSIEIVGTALAPSAPAPIEGTQQITFSVLDIGGNYAEGDTIKATIDRGNAEVDSIVLSNQILEATISATGTATIALVKGAPAKIQIFRSGATKPYSEKRFVVSYADTKKYTEYTNV